MALQNIVCKSLEKQTKRLLHWNSRFYSTANDVSSGQVVNRNPRNLENLRIAIKPKGWTLDSPEREWWHKLHFSKKQQEVCAKIVHHTGETVIRVSSAEWPIRKHLLSATDVCAVENVARVLARRCLQSGLHCVYTDFDVEETRKEQIKVLLTTLQKEGITLQEPPTIDPKTKQTPFEENITDTEMHS